MMTSRIGCHKKKLVSIPQKTPLKLRRDRTKVHKALAGFTFVEVMVTLAILSGGIVLIFRTFFYSLEQMETLTERLYVDAVIENRISQIERMLKVYDALPFQVNRDLDSPPSFDNIAIKESVEFKEVEGFSDIFEMKISESWKDGKKDIKLSRSAYLLDRYRSQ